MRTNKTGAVVPFCLKRTIAFYMQDFSSGGVETTRIALAREFQQLGWRVVIIVNTDHGPLRHAVPGGVEVISLKRERTSRGIVGLARTLRCVRPEFLVASLDHNNLAAMIAGLMSFSGVRIVISQHNSLSSERSLGWKYKVVPRLYRALSTGSVGIVAVSQGVASDLTAASGIPSGNITYIPNAVIDASFPERLEYDVDHPWLRRPTYRLFVFVGRLVAQKNPESLLRAFALLRSPRLHLILVGDGPQRDQLTKLAQFLGISDRVYFAGFQKNPLPWIKCADALILPSVYEGFGNVIVEALACGVPVIATDCKSGPAEILQHGLYGTLVPVDDVERLAAAMECHDRDVFPADKLRRRASAFSVGACVAGHVSLFKNMLEPRHRVLGMRLGALTADQVVRRILIEDPERGVGLVVTPNADHVRLLRRPDFAAACEWAEVMCPDGFPVALFAWMRGRPIARRVTGCDIIHRLFACSDLDRHRLFFVVDSVQTSRALEKWGSEFRRNVQIVVAPPGLLGDIAAQQDIALAARAFGASIMILTLGAPVSELFARGQQAFLPSCWVLCVGQAVRVELGLTRRAPFLFRCLALEWAWRLVHEPRRLSGRYIRSALWFPCAVFLDLIATREDANHEAKAAARSPSGS